ncbi:MULTISPECIES: type III-B CRISPR module-associated protein Cmr5 [unclassified Marinifilum]|uniref:type III-B CRISPR module-associated protein Cmr5 n=1 Tax=unclassified Marinifilum TaxID=2642519 RepID=UPI002274FDC6|nr:MULTISPECIES: type III-B CRISPR module-associated protein Cmr5 [unclassified Marinifilum]MCY1634983.1 hypothetical protein [Marinifilum sp. D737]MDQ2178591.1 hypothetical protein [Marinifilum sp. D714]
MKKLSSDDYKKAFDIVKRVLTIENDDNKVEKSTKSYISSIGASVRCSGLTATVAAYIATEGKEKVIKALGQFIDSSIDKHETVLEKVIAKEISTEQFENAIVAIKLAIRTFDEK